MVDLSSSELQVKEFEICVMICTSVAVDSTTESLVGNLARAMSHMSHDLHMACHMICTFRFRKGGVTFHGVSDLFQTGPEVTCMGT